MFSWKRRVRVSTFSKEEPVIDGMGEILPGTEITFSGLDGGMAEQKLDLFEVAAGGAAEFGAGAAEVMGGQVWSADDASVFLHDPPNDFFGYAIAPDPVRFVDRPEQPS